jgi:integrase
MSASGHESGRLPSAARRQRLRRRPRSLRGYGQPVGRRRTRTAGAPRSRAASYRVDALAFWTMPSSQAVLADWLPFASIVALLTLTGQRRDEVTKLAWEEVDENTSVWSIAGSRTKNGRPHIVHLSEPALHVLHQTPRIGALAFFVDGEYPFQNFGHAKARLDASADVHSWVLHDLRRTVVNGMARLGVPPPSPAWPLSISVTSSLPNGGHPSPGLSRKQGLRFNSGSSDAGVSAFPTATARCASRDAPAQRA